MWPGTSLLSALIEEPKGSESFACGTLWEYPGFKFPLIVFSHVCLEFAYSSLLFQFMVYSIMSKQQFELVSYCTFIDWRICLSYNTNLFIVQFRKWKWLRNKPGKATVNISYIFTIQSHFWDWDRDFFSLVSNGETDTETFDLWSQTLRLRLCFQWTGLKPWDHDWYHLSLSPGLKT